MNNRYFHYIIFAALVISLFIVPNFLWGIFFILQTIPAYFRKAVFFIDMIYRDDEPIFYWLVFLTWIGLGVLMVLQDIPVVKFYLQ